MNCLILSEFLNISCFTSTEYDKWGVPRLLLNQVAFKCTPNVNCSKRETLTKTFDPLFEEVVVQYLNEYYYEPVQKLLLEEKNFSSYIRKKVEEGGNCNPENIVKDLKTDIMLNTIAIQQGN